MKYRKTRPKTIHLKWSIFLKYCESLNEGGKNRIVIVILNIKMLPLEGDKVKN